MDSLHAVWNDDARADTVRLAAGKELIFALFDLDPDSAYTTCLRMERFAASRSLPKWQAVGVGLRGNLLLDKSQYFDAYQAQVECRELHLKAGFAKGAARALVNQAGAAMTMGQNHKAMALLKQAIKECEALNDHEAMAGAYIILSNTLFNAVDRDFTTIEKYLEKAAMTSEADNITVAVLGLRVDVATVKGEHNTALGLARQLMTLLARTGDENCSTEYQLSDIHRAMGRMDSAEYHLKRSLDCGRENGLRRHELSALIGIGMLKQEQKRSKEALGYLKEALGKIAFSQMDERVDLYRTLYAVYKDLGNAGEALKYNEMCLASIDSMKALDTQRIADEIQYADMFAADSLKKAEEKAAMQGAHEEAMGSETNRKRLFMFGGAGLLIIALVLWRVLGRTRKAKAASEEILYNVLPEEVAKEIRDKGAAASKEIDQVSILFTDFKGFTALSEKLSRADLMTELDTCFNAFDRIIGEHGVEKIKTIGDSYMCAAGLKGDPVAAAHHIVQAGLAIQAFMHDHKHQRDAEGKPAFEMRLGIHTGPVVAGIVGVKKFQYDIWGDTVNTASRMESSGEVGLVNISEATYALVKDVESSPLSVVGSQAALHGGSGSAPTSQSAIRLSVSPTTDNQQLTIARAFTFIPRGKVQAKGKGEMEMYFVVRS